KWYILYEFGDFHSQNSQRKIYHLKKDGKSEKVCTIKIFQNVDDSDIKKSLPLLTAYKYSIEKMLLSSGHCGTSNPEVIPKWSGRFYSSMAVIRPWAIEPKWKFTMGNWEQQWAELQQKHFEDWKFQDIWSYREQKSNENLMFDAITELKNHYVSNYSYLEKEAYNHASKVIQAMPSRYYSLGSYYHYEKDFSVFEKILDGTYNNWKNINQDLKFKRSSIPLVALSLIVDTPQAYNRLPSAVDKNLIKSFYQKDLLMFAAHMNNFDSVKYFLEAGWPIDQVTNYEPMSCQPDLARLKRLNRSALTYATENASIEVIKLLVDAGADTKIKDSQGNNLDYYLKLNPRFSAEEKESGFDMLLEKHSKITDVKPSFSCDEKLNRLEKAICSSKGLSIYDRELNKGYKDLIASNQLTIDLKASQIAWLKRRRSECKTYSTDGQLNACLARTTRARIRYLDYIRSALNNSLHPRK
ncbi:lysozyme inhibitor LprI family protein, partial [Vibrio penaeicida]